MENIPSGWELKPRLLRRAAAWCALGVLLAALAWVYQASFEHTPKRDQLRYLLEISRTDGFAEIFEKSYSFNRTRTVEPGDAMLFRPGLFLLLAVQTWLFDYNFEYFRWVSLAIHSVVCFVLYRLLRRLCFDGNIALAENWAKEALPMAVTLLFAFSPAIAEVVAWEHIQGYLVFCGLILFCLDRCVRVESQGWSADRGSITVIWFSLLISTFFHEAGVLFAPAFGWFLAVSRATTGRRFQGAPVFAAFLLIPVIYVALSWGDYQMHAASVVREEFAGGLRTRSTVGGTLFNCLRFTIYCCVQPLFPFGIQTEFGAAQQIMISDIMVPWLDQSPKTNVLRGLFFVMTGLGLVLVAALTLSRAKARRYFPALVCALLALYVSLYVLFRLNVRSDMQSNYLGANSQYVYFCMPLALSLVFPAFLMLAGRLKAGRSRRLMNAGLLYLGLAVGFSALQTRMLNCAAVDIYANIRANIWTPGRQALDQIRAAGKSRVGFLFEDPLVPFKYSQLGVPLTTIFFGRHESFENIEAYVLMPAGKVIYPGDLQWRGPREADSGYSFYVRTASYDGITVRKNGRQCELDSSFAVFRDRDEWMANLSVYPYLPAALSKNLPFSVHGGSLEEVLDRSRSAAEQARMAAKNGEFLLEVPGIPLFRERYGSRLLVQALGKYFAFPDRATDGKEIEGILEGRFPEFPDAATLEDLKRKIDALNVSP